MPNVEAGVYDNNKRKCDWEKKKAQKIGFLSINKIDNHNRVGIRGKNKKKEGRNKILEGGDILNKMIRKGLTERLMFK